LTAARSNPTRRALFERELAWADSIARMAAARLPAVFELPDLQQTARLALWKACLDYDPQRDAPHRSEQGHWRAFAYPRVHGAVMMTCRRRRYREATEWERLPEHDGWPVSPVQECCAERARLADVLHRAIESLPRHERTVVERYFLRGWKVASIAAQYHVSRDTAYRLRKRALLILRRELGALGIHGSAMVWG
jgi:RNA polymerase sigma factor (sigma-70 family)